MTITASNTVSNLMWTSVPKALPINSALLSAAKSLLQNLYTFTAGTLDYLPTSYTDFSGTNTQYTVHGKNASYVYWPATDKSQITWMSTSITDMKSPIHGWGGTITQAGVSAVAVQPAACFTDCSGFITSLFTVVNQQSPTAFTGWAVNQSIPEAGCFDPATGLTPNPANYYSYFKNASNGFTSVDLTTIQPGDLLAFASGDKAAGDTGHIMLIVAVAPVEIGQTYVMPDGSNHTVYASYTTTTQSTTATQLTLAVIFDETATIHGTDSTLDSRAINGNPTATPAILPSSPPNGGVGAGIVLLYMDNNQLQFGWSFNAAAQLVAHPNSAVALGRASQA